MLINMGWINVAMTLSKGAKRHGYVFFFFFFVLEDDLLYQLFRLGYSTTWDYPQSIMKERKKMGHKSRAYDRGLGIESRA